MILTLTGTQERPIPLGQESVSRSTITTAAGEATAVVTQVVIPTQAPTATAEAETTADLGRATREGLIKATDTTRGREELATSKAEERILEGMATEEREATETTATTSSSTFLDKMAVKVLVLGLELCIRIQCRTTVLQDTAMDLPGVAKQPLEEVATIK